MAAHDNSYKLLFSHPRMVEDLLRGFVRGRWVEQLDFSSLQKVNSRVVSDNLRDRESDVIWRVRWNDTERETEVYVLVEFQSRPDHLMAVRLQTYVGLLYQDLARRKQFTRRGKLPPVLPLVLYNGVRRWNAPAALADLIEYRPEELRQYCSRLCYFLIDEVALRESEIPGPTNLVGMLIRLERSHSGQDAVQLVHELWKQLRSPELSELRRHFATWIQRVLVSRFPGAPIPEFDDVEEVPNVLAENMVRWTRELRREGRQEGRQEGRKEGQAAMLVRLLTRRFGVLPHKVEERVANAALEHLECWSDRLFDARTLDEVFSGDSSKCQ